MPHRESSWPAGWPSFTPEDNYPSNTYQEELKKAIISEYGADALRQAWVKTCNTLESVTSRIAEAGPSAVPIFTYDEVTSPGSEDALNRMKETGCFIVRGAIPRDEASHYFEDLKEFIAQNPSITGWPAKSPAIFHLYSSPVQLTLRTHPNQLKLQRLLNSFFTDATCSMQEQEAQTAPILYPDALRIRAPGQDFLGLGPHIDAGSLSRWADDKYCATYSKILSGLPEDYDPYDLTNRRDAKPGMFPGGAHSSVLRTFQGWTALTPCAPGEGGLMVVPDIKTATAYMILRPFFKEPEDGDWQDPEKWSIDESAWFPGTRVWDSQLLSPASHPHLRLEDTLVSVPAVEPGDTIWWHADVSNLSFYASDLRNCRRSLILANRCAMPLKQSITAPVQQASSTFQQHHQHPLTRPISVNIGKICCRALHQMITSILMGQGTSLY